ncbi:MAG: ChbG/HpnK family deacetylase [Gammaproteobacteria bacterium]
MKIIINADNLGLSEPVNDAIFAMMRAGRVTSATLVANGAAVEDAATTSP